LWKYETKGNIESVAITPDGGYIIVKGTNNIYFFTSLQAILKAIARY